MVTTQREAHSRCSICGCFYNSVSSGTDRDFPSPPPWAGLFQPNPPSPTPDTLLPSHLFQELHRKSRSSKLCRKEGEQHFQAKPWLLILFLLLRLPNLITSVLESSLPRISHAAIPMGLPLFLSLLTPGDLSLYYKQPRCFQQKVNI